MATVSTGIFGDSNFMNLKSIGPKEVRPEVFDLLLEDEKPVAAFKTVRDQVIFTTMRVFVVNVQGITGKKHPTFHIPIPRHSILGWRLQV